MPEWGWLGKALVLTGAFLVLLGLVILLGGRIPFVGRLPGDFHYQKGNFTVYFPLATSLLLSLLLTIILNLLGRR